MKIEACAGLAQPELLTMGDRAGRGHDEIGGGRIRNNHLARGNGDYRGKICPSRNVPDPLSEVTGAQAARRTSNHQIASETR
jgi:hypothetical protein